MSQDLSAEAIDNNADDGDTQGQDERVKALARLWRILICNAPKERQAAEWLARLTSPSSVGARRQRTLVKLLADEDGSVAYAAARYLLDLGETKLPELARTLVEHGLTNDERRDDATRLLDGLRSQPAAAYWVSEALNRALWGSNEDAAFAAALYMWEYGDRNLGIPRGLVFGGLLSWRWKEVERHLRRIMVDASLRGAAIDALTAVLYSESDGKLRAAWLLIEFGAPIHDLLVTVMFEWARWQPESLLALLAITGRMVETRDAARRTGLHEFVDLLGSEPFAGA